MARLLLVLLLSAPLVFGDEGGKFASGPNGMAATGSTYATEAATRILGKGGNAIDAAAAASFVLMVTDPANTSLGGRAQIILRLKSGKVVTVDGATESPSRISPIGKDEDRRSGYMVAPIPGAPAALESIVRRFGRLSLEEVMKPAIELAENGFIVPQRLGSTWEKRTEVLSQNPGARRHFLKADGSAYKAGDLFKQTVLAETLRFISKEGTSVLYGGRLAGLIATDMAKNGGFVRFEDLKQYTPDKGNAVFTNYRGFDVASAGGRAWGNTLAELLNILENFELGPKPDANEIELFARIIAQAMDDRPQQIGNLAPKPGGFSLEELSTKEFAKHRAEMIRKQMLRPTSPTKDSRQQQFEKGDTTHLAVMDKEGNAVSLTMSIGPSFGARVATSELGFLYAHSYQMRSNATPRTRDLTEMTPTIVFRDGKPILAIGGAGSERIPTAVFQVISNVIDRGWSLEKSMVAPRLFCIGKKLRLRDTRPDGLADILKSRGFEIEIVTDAASRHNGLVHAVSYDPAKKIFFGAADPIDSGTAAGPSRLD